MNNVCNRKCLWNYYGQCCPEDFTHYEDGTAHTKNCTEFLSGKFEDKLINTLNDCTNLLSHMNYKELKKARYSLKRIKQKEKTNFDVITESPEKLAEYITKCICGYKSGCEDECNQTCNFFNEHYQMELDFINSKAEEE